MSIYWGKTFFTFLLTLLGRIKPLVLGNAELQSDEIQIVALILMSVMCSAVGIFLVVRKMAMVANAITHTVLLGITLAVAGAYYISGVQIGVMGGGLSTTTLCIAAIVTSVLTMVMIEVLCSKFKLQEDVSIGLVFSFLFALGVVAATIFTRNSHIGTEVIAGNIDLIVFKDLKMLLILASCVISTIVIFWRYLVVSSFDSQFASISGISGRALNYLIVLLTSLTIIVSMRAVGVVLVLALIIAPVLIARLFFDSLRAILFASIGIGVFTSIFSVALSRHLLTSHGVPLSTAGLVVAILFVLWTMASLLSPSKGVIAFMLRKRQFRNDLELTFQAKVDKLG